MRTLLSLIFISLFLNVNVADAQTFPKRAKGRVAPPKALLVTLLTRPNQRAHLKKHRPDLLPEFERDVREVAKRTVLDYSRYFKYCPVYFSIDTQANRIAAGDWEGILLDSVLQPVRNPVIRPGDKDFFIAHYGTPMTQPDSARAPNPGDLGSAVEAYGDDPTALFREELIVKDADFQLLLRSRGPRTNHVRVLRPSGMTLGEYRRYRRSTTYNAQRWYIDYMPTAYSYEVTLRKFFR